MDETYDLVIIGSGSAGLTAARFAAQLGVHVALVEKDRVGGDCTWTGCVPSKALLKVAKVIHSTRHADQYGIRTTPPTVDMSGCVYNSGRQTHALGPQVLDRLRSPSVCP
jgi:pyruvate/2-oxoglutarate dehydrogenase complex dihydrolipoamide dehydrogenase (E3) component